MKSLFAVTLASLLTLTTALPARDPPGPSYGAPPAAGRPKGIKVEEIQPQFSPNHKRVRVTYGRYLLKPYNETTMSMGGGMAGGMDAMAGKGMGGGMDMGGKGMGGSMDMGGKGKGGGMDMGGKGMPSGMGKKDEDKDQGGMENEGGLTDASYTNAPKPCSDCTLKYAKSYLTYPDGSVANIDSGAWVHHLTMSVTGPGREDLRCPGGTQRIPKGMERMLAFHNDRNETYFGVTALDKMGFYLGQEDSITLELMLKNELNVPKEAEYSIEYEFVPGRPEGWGDVRGIWVDVAPCSAAMSDLPIPKGKTKFTVSGDPWKSTINGRLLNTVGHMHDGGLVIDIKQNGQSVCASKAVYEGHPGYIPSKDAISKGAADMAHINYYTPCLDIGEIKKGDVLDISASYDLDKYKPLTNKIGAESDVMGLALLFVEVRK
jgi:hypothetical protein